VYDASGNGQPLRSARIAGGGTCGTKPCWKAIGTTRYQYASKGNAESITQLQLKAGADGRSQVKLKDAARTLAPPDPSLTRRSPCS